MRYWNAGFIAVTAGVLAVLGAVGPGSAQAVKGKLPPDFTGTTLEGRKISLSDFRGKHPVVLNFYAGVAPTCRKQLSHLKELDDKFSSRGLRLLAVSMDEDREAASAAPRESRVRFPVLFDPKGAIGEKYQVQAIPHTVVLDKDGVVRSVIVGLDADELDRAVSDVLK